MSGFDILNAAILQNSGLAPNRGIVEKLFRCRVSGKHWTNC